MRFHFPHVWHAQNASTNLQLRVKLVPLAWRPSSQPSPTACQSTWRVRAPPTSLTLRLLETCLHHAKEDWIDPTWRGCPNPTTISLPSTAVSWIWLNRSANPVSRGGNVWTQWRWRLREWSELKRNYKVVILFVWCYSIKVLFSTIQSSYLNNFTIQWLHSVHIVVFLGLL